MLRHYAIGDVHGRDDLLERMLERIASDRIHRGGGDRAVLVYVGDYIDRGARSAEVIDRVMRGVDGFDTVCLKGNHEQMMLDCMRDDAYENWTFWLENGGDETLASLGLPRQRDPIALAAALGTKRLAWLDGLKISHRAGPYLFVHAGVLPGRPLDQQLEKDMLWIRRRFLDSEDDHGAVVVHGHTPSEDPELRPNRINVDTGATLRGKLSAVALGQGEAPRFITVEGNPGRGP